MGSLIGKGATTKQHSLDLAGVGVCPHVSCLLSFLFLFATADVLGMEMSTFGALVGAFLSHFLMFTV
jgi:hypothetical protein